MLKCKLLQAIWLPSTTPGITKKMCQQKWINKHWLYGRKIGGRHLCEGLTLALLSTVTESTVCSEDRHISSQYYHIGHITLILQAMDWRTDFYKVFRLFLLFVVCLLSTLSLFGSKWFSCPLFISPASTGWTGSCKPIYIPPPHHSNVIAAQWGWDTLLKSHIQLSSLRFSLKFQVSMIAFSTYLQPVLAYLHGTAWVPTPAATNPKLPSNTKPNCILNVQSH